MRYGFINNFSQTLAAELAQGATTMTLDGGGALLANASAEMVYTLTLFDVTSGENEIVHITAASGNDLTVERGQEGTADVAWPTGSQVEMRVTAGTLTALNDQVRVHSSGATAVGPGAEATTSQAVAMGYNAEATAQQSVAVGSAVTSSGGWTVAVGLDTAASGEFSAAFGAYANAEGEESLALGEAEARADMSVAIGGRALVNNGADGALVIGYDAQVGVDAWEAVALGPGAFAGARGTAVGHGAFATAGALALGDGAEAPWPTAVALGKGAQARADESVALGPGPIANVPGGMTVGALSYVSKVPVPGSRESTYVSPAACRQSTAQVAIATHPVDLTDGGAAVTLDLPDDLVLFVDAIDVVVVGASDAGGAPGIIIGPDDQDPDTYLAATPVTKTAVGGRETHAPLVSDGVTSLRVAVDTAGTGTTFQAKIVFRGYVMEL